MRRAAWNRAGDKHRLPRLAVVCPDPAGAGAGGRADEALAATEASATRVALAAVPGAAVAIVVLEDSVAAAAIIIVWAILKLATAVPSLLRSKVKANK